jgi:hypothetical protein
MVVLVEASSIIASSKGGWGMVQVKSLQIAVVLGVVALAGCATASPVMDAGDGTYLISARAAPVRGGATGAQTVAYNDAQKFCAQRGMAFTQSSSTPRNAIFTKALLVVGLTSMVGVSADLPWLREA